MLTAEDIVSENPTAVALRATAAVSWAFRHFNIFLGNQPQLPVNPAMVIEVPKAAVMEEYAAFPGARRLYSIGAFSYAMCNEASLAMGRYCSVAHNVSVLGERHGMEWLTTSPLIYHFGPHTTMPAFNAAQAQLMGGENKPNFPPGRFGPFPVLGHDVWVGQNVVLARGITIGTGAVIAAGAVVTSDVAPYTIVGGVPARVIRLRFPMDLAARLLASRWWDYHPEMLAKFNVADPAAFMDAFDEAQGAGSLRFLDVRRITWRDLLGVDDPDRFNKKTMVD